MRKLYYLNKFLHVIGLEVIKYNARNNNELRKKSFFSKYTFDVIIDVGANVGGFHDELRQLGYFGLIHSIEPISSVYNSLAERARRDTNWKVYNYALGNYDGEIEINISSNIHSSSVLDILEEHTQAEPGSRYQKRETVTIKKLDTLAASFPGFKSAYLKIDTQGYEYDVLLGANDVIKRTKAIQLEMTLTALYKDQKLIKDIISFMDDKGFELYAIEPGFANEKDGQQYQVDGIFLNRNFVN